MGGSRREKNKLYRAGAESCRTDALHERSSFASEDALSLRNVMAFLITALQRSRQSGDA